MLGHQLRDNIMEYYRIEIVDNGFQLIINEVFFNYLSTLLTSDVKKFFLTVERNHTNSLVIFSVKLPFITYPNYAHKKIDWDALHTCADHISGLLWVFNRLFHEEYKSVSSSFALSSNPQLMLIQTGVGRGEDSHACQIALGFSEEAVNALSEKYPQGSYFKEHAKAMYTLYLRLSESQKRKYERALLPSSGYQQGFMGVTSYIREGGVPQFQVPGNCACLGANPDYFKEDRDMTDHNIDSTLQLVTMLTGVVLFWNEVLRPLVEK